MARFLEAIRAAGSPVVSTASAVAIMSKQIGSPASAGRSAVTDVPKPVATVTILGLTQIFAWGSTYYLPAVLAAPIAADTGWPLTWVVAALSLGSLVSGLVAPRVGRWIDTQGGRPVLCASAIAFALGLAIVASATHLAVYLVGWVVLGFGMAAGLYDAAFSTLAQLFGQDARRRIAALTLFGGFASTVCWPLTAWLESHLGWRGACWAYAALHVCVIVPVYFTLLPKPRFAREPTAPAATATARAALPGTNTPEIAGVPALPLVMLAVSGALAAAIGGVVSVHLLTILQERGIGLAAAVALGALVGPSQVGARVLEMLFGQSLHPLWVLLASTLLVLLGTSLMVVGDVVPATALVLYGAGVGVHSIARGTVPLALFGAERYASVMGRLARPGTIVGALAPTLAAMLWTARGLDAVLLSVVICAAVNVGAALALLRWRQRAP